MFIIIWIWGQPILDAGPRVWFSKIIFYVISLSILFFWFFIIYLTVNYFYSILIVSQDGITFIKYDMNFRDKIKVIDLCTIVSSSASCTWILQTIANYGKVIIRNANDTEIVFKNLPNPKSIADIIERFKKEAIEERSSNSLVDND